MFEDEKWIWYKLDYGLHWCKTNVKAKYKLKNIKCGMWTLENIE